MNGFRMLALQDLSFILSAKFLQHETYVTTNAFKRCLSHFVNFSRKQENTYENRRINLSTVSNNLEPIFTTWMTLPEITTILNFQSSACVLPFKTNTEIMHLEAMKPLIKSELLDENPASRGKCYEMLPNIQTSFGFVHNDNTKIKPDKVYYDDCTSKIISTLRENQQPRIDRTIEQVPNDDLSTYITAKNVNPSPKTPKLELETQEIQQQQSRDLFETLQQSNMMKMQKCTKDAVKLFAFSEIEIPRNIPLEWSSMEWSYPRREYHIWKLSKIKNDTIRCEDRPFFTSDIRIMRQKQSAGYGSSRFGHLAYSGNSGNQGKSSFCLSSILRCVFSSSSCTMIQQSIRGIINMRKDLSINTSIIRLRSTQSHPDRISSVRLQLFSCDASRSIGSADCEKNDRKSQRSKCKDKLKDEGVCSQEVARSSCQIKSKKICGKTRRKYTCVSSQDDTCQKWQRKPELCKSYMCPELKKPMPRNWNMKRCPETSKCDAEGQLSSRDCARSRNSNYSQEQGRKLKLCKRHEDCEKLDESRATCEDLIKEKIDCESECEKRDQKCDINEKERQKCIGSGRKRSNSCRRRNPSRTDDKNSKADGKRHNSQRSMFSIPEDRKSFSTLISDIVLSTNVSKTAQGFHASYSKDKKDRIQGPSCEKRKRKCETKGKDKIKKKCVKSPAKCISRKKTTNKKSQICQSVDIDKYKKSDESTKKSKREKYCSSRKKEFMKDEKLKTEAAPISCTKEDKKPKESIKEPSIKEQIDREYKEMDECKKGPKKGKKGNKAKMVSIEYKPTNLDGIISSYKKHQEKDSEKFASTPNESIIFTDTMFKWFNIQSRVINSKIPIVAKDVKLFNVMFDRSFSTSKLNYQDDFAIERTMNDKIVQNYSANNDDFIHGDELPNYVEIEYEDEEDDVKD